MIKPSAALSFLCIQDNAQEGEGTAGRTASHVLVFSYVRLIVIKLFLAKFA